LLGMVLGEQAIEMVKRHVLRFLRPRLSSLQTTTAGNAYTPVNC
jgi:hypothetical protein